jgi:choline dehydrogenase
VNGFTEFWGHASRSNGLEQARAACEIIVSAGALRSPQLLMLSGIGSKGELKRRGIDVRLDLPGVAKNLQDHLHMRVRCEITQPLTFAPLPDEMKAAELREYETHRSGALGSNFLEAGAFVKSDPQEAYPALQLFFLMTLSPDYPEAGPSNRHGITFTSYISRPLSRGEVTLASADPLDRPMINFNYLSASDRLVGTLVENGRSLAGATLSDVGNALRAAGLPTDGVTDELVAAALDPATCVAFGAVERRFSYG